MINYIAITQLLAFTWFILYVYNRHGILNALSDSWYVLGNDRRPFYVFTMGIGASMYLYGIYIPLVMYAEMFLMIAGTALFFVGIAANFAQKEAGVIHVVAALLSGGFGFTAAWIQYGPWTLVIFGIYAALIGFCRVSHHTTWLEIGAVYLIIGRFVVV